VRPNIDIIDLIQTPREIWVMQEFAKVHQRDGSWWFWDESQSHEIGPYLTQKSALCGLDKYIEYLEEARTANDTQY